MRIPRFKQGDLVLYNDFNGVDYRVVLVAPAKGSPKTVNTVPEYMIKPLIVSNLMDKESS